MRKRKFRTLFMGILTVLCSVFALNTGQECTALASENVFEMTPGGSIRLTESYGLRFQVKMSADVKAAADEVGMLIFPADYLVDNGTEGDIHYESVEALAATTVSDHRIKLDLTRKLYKKDGYWYGNGAIVDIKDKNMAREFVGIAYYEVNGNTVWADTSKIANTTRGAAQVALLVHADKTYTYSDTEKQLLLNYIDFLKSSDIIEDAPTRYQVRGYAADNGLHINAVQYADTLVTTGDSWTEQTHMEAQIWQHNMGYGVENGLNVDTYCAFFLDGTASINNETNVKGVTNIVTINDRGEDYEQGYRYEIRYEIFIEFENNLSNPQDGPYAFVHFKHHMPGETEGGFENSYKEHRDSNRYLYQDDCSSYEFRKRGIVAKVPRIDVDDMGELPFDFPTVEDFANINSDLQSVDPDLYNFQMWTTDSGLYTYFIQTLPKTDLSNSDPWQNPHVEMVLWNGDVGNGWYGTNIALFSDETVSIDNLTNVRSAASHVVVDQSDENKTVIEYYFHLEFDNSTMSLDPSYAYVKQYQFLPGVNTEGLNSTIYTINERTLISGDEKSFAVHSKIDTKMYD
ncbi:MAG: hypothetical protein IJ439_07590 [Tyzzerella sp.]|nr:hypothetical protein [Tyzzerella sp.]